MLQPGAVMEIAQGIPPYALTCLDGYLLGLKEQIFLRLAPAG